MCVDRGLYRNAQTFLAHIFGLDDERGEEASMTAPSWHVEPSGYQAKVLRQRENGDSDGEFEEAWDGTGQVHCAPCTLAAKFHLANLEAAAREGSGDERGQAYAAAQRLLEAARNWRESPNQPVADPDPDTPHGAFGNRNAASVAEHEAALLQRCLPYGKHAGITPGRSDHTRMLEAVIHACTGILHEMRREEHHERMAAHEALRQVTRKLTFATIGLVIVTGVLVAVTILTASVYGSAP